MAGEVYLGAYGEVVVSRADDFPGAGDLVGEVLTWDGFAYPALPCIADTWIEAANPDTAHGDEDRMDDSEADPLFKVTSAWNEDVTWNTRPTFDTAGAVYGSVGGVGGWYWIIEDGSLVTANGFVLKVPGAADGTVWVLLKFHADCIGESGVLILYNPGDGLATREAELVQGGGVLRPVFLVGAA